jgi:glycosyltransferase involved in cell wall biosynthesis
MKLLYATRSSLPSRAAHSVQILSMARAFHECLGPAFRRLTGRAGGGGTSIDFAPAFQWETLTGEENQWRRYARLFWKVFFQVGKNRETVVFTRDVALALATVLAGNRAVYEAHMPPAGGIAKRMHRLLASNRNYRLVAISEALADFYRNNHEMPEDRILACHNAVFPEDYHDLRRVGKTEARRRLGLPEDRKIVVCTGSLYENFHGLFEHVARGRENLLFLSVGGSDAECSACSAYYRDRKVDNIHFLPWVPHHLARQYQMAADLLFYPLTRSAAKWRYTSPIKLFEYMATGVPILGARIGSLKEVLNDDNAFCFDPERPESIDSAFCRWRENPALAKKRAQQALNDVEEKYSWYGRARKIVDFAFGARE